MASRVQKIMFWDTFKNAKSVILHYFPVAEIGSNIHLLYFSYPQEIWAQFVEWGKKVLRPYRPHWSVYFSVSLLQIAGKHPVVTILDGGWTTEHRPQSSRWDKHPASICKQQDQSGERREGPHSELPGVRLWGRTGALHWIQSPHALGLDSDVLESIETEENALNIHCIDNFFKSV